MDGEFRVRKWRSGKGLLNQRVCRLIPNGQPMTADFLYYSIGRPLKQIEDFTPFTTVKHISAGQIRAIELPLPPLPEQKKIAHILSTVQRAIEAQERIIQTTTELKKALMHKLFTEGLHHEPQKQTEIGPVPESWEVCKVGDVAKIQSGGTPTRETAENWSGGSIPWVKTGEINYCVIHDTEEKITPTGLANSSARLYPKGTLLMAMYGQGITRGRVGLLGIEAATNQACASITPTGKKRVSSVFLYYFFEYHYEDLRKLGHGANQRNMNAALIRSFPLMFPKADEQAAVVTALESLDEKRVLHESKKTQLQDLFRTLLHELMTAKTRVNEHDFPHEDTPHD
jgi:type I restriction enzyme S subunit